MLFFFAGYEIDLRADRRAAAAARRRWAGSMSLVIAYTIGGVLAAAGIVLSLLYTGSALATTAIGTLIPVLSDSGELQTRLRHATCSAAGAVGEFGPILLLTLVLSTQSALHNALILIAFVALAVGVARDGGALVRRARVPLFERTIEKSSQLAVRWIVVLVFALALLASELGLDLLLGGFAAGLITRQVLKTREVPAFDSKLTAVAFGVFIPFFFVVSGMQLDVDALFASVVGRRRRWSLFFVLFLVVRGTPALLLYRDVLDRRGPAARSRCSRSTQLPLVLAITTRRARRRAHALVDRRVAGRRRRSLSTLACPLHRPAHAPGDGASDAHRRRGGRRSRVSQPARRTTGPRRRPFLPPAHLARARRCGCRCSRRTWSRSCSRSACRSSTSTSATSGSLPIAAAAAQAIFGALAGGMITFTGIVFSAVFVAAQIQTSSYSPAARRAAAPRSGRHRRPRRCRRRPRSTRCSRSRRSAARPTGRAATSCPPPP